MIAKQLSQEKIIKKKKIKMEVLGEAPHGHQILQDRGLQLIQR